MADSSESNLPARNPFRRDEFSDLDATFGEEGGPTQQDTQMGDIEFGMGLWPFLNWVGKLGFMPERTYIYKNEADERSYGATMSEKTDYTADEMLPYLEPYQEHKGGRHPLGLPGNVFINEEVIDIPDTYGHEYMHRGIDVMTALLGKKHSARVPLDGGEVHPSVFYGNQNDRSGDRAHSNFVYPEQRDIIRETLSDLQNEEGRDASFRNATSWLENNVGSVANYDDEHIRAMNEIAKELYYEFHKRPVEEQDTFLGNLQKLLFGDSEKSE